MNKLRLRVRARHVHELLDLAREDRPSSGYVLGLNLVDMPKFAKNLAAKLAGRYPDVRAKMTAQRLNALFRCDVDRLSAHLRDFSDTRLVLDAKRADWLKARYYAE